jgi:hypothetical protein
MFRDFNIILIYLSQTALVPMALSKIKKANINWNSFVQQSEPKVKDNPANTTKSYMSGLFCFLAGGPTLSSSSSDAGHFGRPPFRETVILYTCHHSFIAPHLLILQ